MCTTCTRRARGESSITRQLERAEEVVAIVTAAKMRAGALGMREMSWKGGDWAFATKVEQPTRFLRILHLIVTAPDDHYATILRGIVGSLASEKGREVTLQLRTSTTE